MICKPVLFISSLMLLFLAGTSIAEEIPSAEGNRQGNILISVENLDPERGGELVIFLFRGEAGWPKQKAAIQKLVFPVREKVLSTELKNVSFSSNYAVQVHHDQNSNGKLDMRWFPYPRPKEGAGVSNNHERMGPPRFDDARFELNAAKVSLSIQMRY